MKCFFSTCIKSTSKTIGFCQYCKLNFCLSHRFIEDHNCINFDVIIKDKKEKLSKELQNNKSPDHRLTSY